MIDFKSIDRYSRQIRFHGVGEEGQRKLLASKVTLCGCGALGTVLANNLARAGVGSIKVVDRDFIEPSNLQRQVLFDENDVTENLPKAELLPVNFVQSILLSTSNLSSLLSIELRSNRFVKAQISFLMALITLKSAISSTILLSNITSHGFMVV